MSTKSKESKVPKEVKPKTETKGVEPVKTPEVVNTVSEVKEPVAPVVPPTEPKVEPAATPEDSIQSHSAQVTEGDAAQSRSQGVDLKEQPLDPHDGAQLDQNVEAAQFDVKKEEKLAHAKAPEAPEHIKHAIVNPNGVGNEWPRG